MNDKEFKKLMGECMLATMKEYNLQTGMTVSSASHMAGDFMEKIIESSRLCGMLEHINNMMDGDKEQ